MRFPTSMKLLWENLEWLYRYICKHCGELGIRHPRNKYKNVAESYLSYCKKRKRKASRTRMLKRCMIRLLEKLLIQRDEIHREYGTSLRYTQDYQKRLSIIRKVLVQEKEILKGGKSVTVSSALTDIIYVPSSEARKPNPSSSVRRLTTYR